MSRQTRIEQALQALSPTHLKVINDSASHHGHGGDDGSGETHYTVHVTASCFAGRTRVERHRMVMTLLADELATGLHAISLILNEK